MGVEDRMALKKSLGKVKNFIKKRYKGNLAGLLIFGSANTGHFVEGKSDIDAIILLKNKEGVNFEEEIILLSDSLKSENFTTQYFHTLQSIKDYILEGKSWGTFITIVSDDGCLVLCSSSEFEGLREWFVENPLDKDDCIKYLCGKNKSDVNGYFKKAKGYELTKSLMAHIRKQLQMLNFLKNGGLVYNYEDCLDNSELGSGDKDRLMVLYDKYSDREGLGRGAESYFDYIKKLNKMVQEI